MRRAYKCWRLEGAQEWRGERLAACLAQGLGLVLGMSGWGLGGGLFPCPK